MVSSSEGLQGIDRHCGLSELGVVVGIQQRDIRVNDRLDRRIFSGAAGDCQVLSGAADHFISAASLGAHTQEYLAQGRYCSDKPGRRAPACCQVRQRLLAGTCTPRMRRSACWVGVAVTADDSVQPGNLSSHRGIDVLVDLNAGRILSKADVGKRQHDIVAAAQMIRELLCFHQRIGEGQAGDVAGQLVIGDAVVADAQDGDFDALSANTLLNVRGTSSARLSSPYAPSSLRLACMTGNWPD